MTWSPPLSRASYLAESHFLESSSSGKPKLLPTPTLLDVPLDAKVLDVTRASCSFRPFELGKRGLVGEKRRRQQQEDEGIGLVLRRRGWEERDGCGDFQLAGDKEKWRCGVKNW